MKITRAQATDELEIRQLLAQCELPYEDLTVEQLNHFFVCTERDRLIGVIGLELCGESALLRSLAVAEARRGHGLGRQLVERAEEHAQSLGVKLMCLLTIGAENFFARLSYRIVHRTAAPKEIQETTEFASLCPSSSVCMVKRLGAVPNS